MAQGCSIYAQRKVTHVNERDYVYYTFNSQRRGTRIWSGLTDRKNLILKVLRIGTEIGESMKKEELRLSLEALRQDIIEAVERLTGRERYMLQYKIRGEVKRFIWGRFGRPEDAPLPPLKDGDYGVYLTRSPREGMSERYRDKGNANFATLIPMSENWHPKGWGSDAPMRVGTESACREFVQILLLIRKYEDLEKQMEKEEDRIHRLLSKWVRHADDLTDEELARIYPYLQAGAEGGLYKFQMFKRVDHLL